MPAQSRSLPLSTSTLCAETALFASSFTAGLCFPEEVIPAIYFCRGPTCKWIFFSLKSCSSLFLVWPGHHQLGLEFLTLMLFHTEAKDFSGLSHAVKRQPVQRCKLFLGKFARAVSSPGEPKPLEIAGTGGVGAQHQCGRLQRVEVRLGPLVQFGNPLRCVSGFSNHC